MEKYLFKKVIFNTFIQGFGKVFSVIASFISVYVLTRYLGVEKYGNFTLIFAYLGMFSIISDFGLNLTVVKELTKETDDYRNKLIYGSYLRLRMCFLLFSSLITLLVLFIMPYNFELKMAIFLGLFGINIGILSGFINPFFQVKLRIDLISLVDVITKLFTIIFVILFVFLKANFYWIVSTILIGNLFGLILTIFLFFKRREIIFFYDKNIAKKLIISTIPVGISSLLSLYYFKVDTLILSVLKSSVDVGYYGVAYKIFENSLVLWGYYMATMYPILSKKVVNREDFIKFIKKNIRISIFSAGILIALIYILTPSLIFLIAGASYSKSIPSLRILILSLPFFYLNNIFYHVFLIKDKTKTIIKIVFISLIFNLFLNLLIIPKYSFIGASITTVITEMMISVYYIYSFFIFLKTDEK